MKLTDTCKHCHKFYGDHRTSDDACPKEKYRGLRGGWNETQTFEMKGN